MTQLDELRRNVLRWRKDPVAWVRDILGAEPDEWQCEFLRAYATEGRLSVRSGHGTGKSTAVSWMILHFINTRLPCKVLVTGSNFDQLKATLWAEVGAWRDKMPAALRDQWDYSTEGIKLKAAPTQSFAALRTASKDRSQNLAGFHSPNFLAVADEASAIDDSLFEVIGGTLTTEGSKLVLTGNPTQASGYFFRSHNQNRHMWWTRRISCLDVPRVSRAWIEEQKADYGEQSNVYRVRVLGDFPSGDDDGVIPLSLIEAAVGRDVATTDVAPIWGLDPARYGSDRSALVKRQGNTVEEPAKTWQGKDGPELAGLLKREWIDTDPELRPSAICVDVIGVGASAYDALKRDDLMQRNGTSIVAVNVSESASLSERYERMRDELWFRAREWFQARDCKIANDQTLIGEMSTPKYKILPNGRYKVESKDDLKARGIRSPDVADSLILTFAQVELAGKTTAGRQGHNFIVQNEYDETNWRGSYEVTGMRGW